MSITDFMQGWLQSEESARDCINVKRIYIDINDGNLNDGVIFSQIMFWHGNNLETGQPRLKIKKHGHLWLAKAYKDWVDECRIKPRRARTAIENIEQRGLIETNVWKFNGTPMLHIRVKWEALESAIKDKKSKNRAETIGNTGSGRNRQIDVAESGRSKWQKSSLPLTETTSKEHKSAATQLYTVAPLLYKETGKLPPPKVIPEECTAADSSFFDLSGQGVQDSPLTQGDQVASLTDYATDPNDSSGQKAITLPEIEKVPQRSKRLNKRGAHRTKLQYDKRGWLQLPYGKLYKLPRWMATRIMQYELAFDYLDYELAGTAPDGSLVVEGKDGTMTLDTAFGGPHSGGRLPLQLLRDCATQDRGQSRTIDQEWYNEELQLQFEQCVNWCERMGPDALTVINERGLLSLFTEYAEGADNRRYEWDEVEG